MRIFPPSDNQNEEASAPADEAAEHPIDPVTPESLVQKIDQVLQTLTPREREIVKLRYGLGDGYTYTLEQVGQIFDLPCEHVREIEARAVSKLRDRHDALERGPSTPHRVPDSTSSPTSRHETIVSLVRAGNSSAHHLLCLFNPTP